MGAGGSACCHGVESETSKEEKIELSLEHLVKEVPGKKAPENLEKLDTTDRLSTASSSDDAGENMYQSGIEEIQELQEFAVPDILVDIRLEEFPAPSLNRKASQRSLVGMSAGKKFRAVVGAAMFSNRLRSETFAGEASSPVTPANQTQREYKIAKPSGNGNSPDDYNWLNDVLHKLSSNQASSLPCIDTDTKKRMTPLFFVIGACPNILCGMQAVMFTCDSKKMIDFWWVKPVSQNGFGSPKKTPSSLNPQSTLEMETLNRHSSGSHKNDPGRSKPFYKPLADLFEKSQATSSWHFWIEMTRSKTGDEAPRAVMRKLGKMHHKNYVHVLWLEDWTSNPFSMNKYIKGKIVYQRKIGSRRFHCRQFEIHDKKLFIVSDENASFSSVIPPPEVKELWEMNFTT